MLASRSCGLAGTSAFGSAGGVFDENHLAQVGARQRLLGGGDDARFRCDQHARQHFPVFVDAHGVILVDFLPAWVRDGVLGDHVLDVEQVEQRVVERGVDIAAGLGVDRRDAVVEQLVRLRLNLLHELGVLARDDRVVAAHILPAVIHPHVGIEGLLARRVEGGEAPGLGEGRRARGVETFACVDELARRAACQLRPRRQAPGRWPG
jgi:hypothetical protein